MLNLLKKLLILAIILYAGVCAAIYYYPQVVFYNPTTEAASINKAHADGYRAEVVRYYSKDGTELSAWYTKPRNTKKIIVFMHGNSYNIEKFYQKMMPFVKVGYGTFMPEYRGFGNVKGKINQENLEADANAAINYLHSKGYKNEDIIVYGMSLGSHMAVNSVYSFQSQGNFAALVLEVPFDSLQNVINTIVPVPLPLDKIMHDKYDNTEMIYQITCPVLVMGGSIDPTVPVELAQNLYAYAKDPKHIIVYEGAAHNNLYDFGNYVDIINWLKNK